MKIIIKIIEFLLKLVKDKAGIYEQELKESLQRRDDSVAKKRQLEEQLNYLRDEEARLQSGIINTQQEIDLLTSALSDAEMKRKSKQEEYDKMSDADVIRVKL